MDPRKTIVMADFERVVRRVREAAAKPAQSGDVVAPRSDSRELAKTHAWTERPRGEASQEASVMHYRSAQAWARQATRDPQLGLTRVRPSPLHVDGADTKEIVSSVQATERFARVSQDHSEIRIPRSFRLPSPRAIRIACLSLALVAASALALTLPEVARPAAPVVRPASVRVTADAPRRPAGRAPAAQLTAASIAPQPAVTQPTAAASAARAPAPDGSGVSPRSAIDALISGRQDLALARYRALASSRPADPVYATAAQILEDARKRTEEEP